MHRPYVQTIPEFTKFLVVEIDNGNLIRSRSGEVIGG